MVVLNPLKIDIINYDQLGFPKNNFIDVPFFPTDSNKIHSIATDNIIYIEKTDFQEVFIFIKYYYILSIF